jgi:hypothetical protein
VLVDRAVRAEAEALTKEDRGQAEENPIGGVIPAGERTEFDPVRRKVRPLSLPRRPNVAR